jgi:hypothetical protein
MSHQISVTKILSVFYLIISCSMLQPLLSKQWNTAVQNSRIAQHIIGFVSVLSLILFVSDGYTDNQTIFVYGIGIYLWFLLCTKLDIHLNIMIIILVLVGAMYENQLKYRKNMLSDDKILTDDEKYIIVKREELKNKMVVGGLIVLTLIGTYTYSRKKQIQYGGGGFDAIKFLFY